MKTFAQFVITETEHERTAERTAHEQGERNFKALAQSDPELHKAISSFKYDPVRHDYCGDCADALRDHLHKHGFTDFQGHHHGHSFLGNSKHVVDAFDGRRQVWKKDDPVLKRTVYSTHSPEPHDCWCHHPQFKSERIG